ncbi:MAG TPA: DNA-binding protein, partial [Alphaproteobacteria bacterium]|nr:DNA-binding protein [Alphaproteobacteria bacterium]
MSNTDYYLPEGLPAPMAARDGLDMPYRKGLEEDKL